MECPVGLGEKLQPGAASGGQGRRSDGKKRFLELLSGLDGTPLCACPEHIMRSLAECQGAEKRRDDVSVAGFRLA